MKKFIYFLLFFPLLCKAQLFEVPKARICLQNPGAGVRMDSLEVVLVDKSTCKYYRKKINFRISDSIICCNSGCTTPNFIPKQDPANPTQQICSQIYDNGTSVGINYTGPFNYSFTYGSNTVSGNARLWVNGVIIAENQYNYSDKRFKKDILSIETPLQKIMKLKGVTYTFDNEKFPERNLSKSQQIGFIAQEVEKIVPQAVIKDDEGYYAMNYNMLIPVLTEAIKEQQKMIEEQQKQIDELKAIINSASPKSINVNPTNSIKLYQNNPNPFGKETEIKFAIPETVKQASIKIYDLSGKQLRSIEINDRNEASVKIFAKEFPAGMYIYSLITDGNEADSKRMILTDN